MLTLDSSSASEEAAAAEASAVLQRMHIDWLWPLGKATGPWRVNRRNFAEYFDLTSREWLVGEQTVRPVCGRRNIGGREQLFVRFVLAPDGPLAWSWGAEPTDLWGKVERLRAKLQGALESATTADEFQQIGLLSRDVAIVCAQAVYDRAQHPPSTDQVPGRDDAKRMLMDVLAVALKGAHKDVSALVKALWDVAVHLQHKREADYTEAAICAAAAVALVDVVRVLRGRPQGPAA
jgi:hypothetical protein